MISLVERIIVLSDNRRSPKEFPHQPAASTGLRASQIHRAAQATGRIDRRSVEQISNGDPIGPRRSQAVSRQPAACEGEELSLARACSRLSENATSKLRAETAPLQSKQDSRRERPIVERGQGAGEAQGLCRHPAWASMRAKLPVKHLAGGVCRLRHIARRNSALTRGGH